uniref:Phosphagen kinase C-terminal domain-containing protein n=1 Tax=Caenorhabditis tropicalis TaxID=1561998 RepID=A0A1I7TWC0_9PELO
MDSSSTKRIGLVPPKFYAATSVQKRGQLESPVAKPPVKRAHVEEFPETENGCQTDEVVLKVSYKPEKKLICGTKDRILASVDLGEIIKKKVELHTENFRNVCLPFDNTLDFRWWTHDDVLEMTSQFMEAEEVEAFRMGHIDGYMLIQPREDLFFELNRKKAIFSWRTFQKLPDMITQIRVNIARNACGPDSITERSTGWSDRPLPVVKSFKEIGIQVDPIETVVDKLDTRDAHVAAGRIRIAMMDLLQQKKDCYRRGFSSVALPFDHSSKSELWNHEQMVEVVAQFLPNSAAHAIDSQPIVGYNYPKFCVGSQEGKKLFKSLNLYTANISVDEFYQIGKNFDSVYGARLDYEVEKKEAELRKAEEEEEE